MMSPLIRLSYRLLIASTFAFLLCSSWAYARPGIAGYFKYTIDITINDHPYSFSQFIKCSRHIQPSEGPEGPFYVRSELSGGGFVGVKLDTSHTLLYYVNSECLQETAEDLTLPVAILETDGDRAKLYIVRGDSIMPSVSVKRIHLEPIADAPDQIGPPHEQIEFTKAIFAQWNRKFQNVTATIIPREVWATSDQSREYFGRLSSVSIAKVGEAPPVSGWPNAFVRFPFYRDRAYKLIDGRITGLKEFELSYTGSSFETLGETSNNVRTFYSETEMQNSQTAMVSYKGFTFNVVAMQEIYDPETRNIYSLRYRPAKNLEELLVVFARENIY